MQLRKIEHATRQKLLKRGGDAETLPTFHQQHGQQFVQAYTLPTDVARDDTTSFNYLSPLPMTGEVPALLRQWIPRPPTDMRLFLHLPTSVDDPTLRTVGKGFSTWRHMQATVADGTVVTWRWCCSPLPPGSASARAGWFPSPAAHAKHANRAICQYQMRA